MFTKQQKADLDAPLNIASVKTRSQSGRTLSYVEGWWVIAEANRIFGFDGWTRETVEIKCVAEHERAIGQSGSKGWGVTYTARVRVTVGDVCRDGCGAGHGIDRDLGQAHESALKEAETDAMKRALMTFGNPFGLALYDKAQSHVSYERENPHVTRPHEIVGDPLDGLPQPGNDVVVITRLSKAQAREDYAKLQKELRDNKTEGELRAWWLTNKTRIWQQPLDWQKYLEGQAKEHKADLRAAAEGGTDLLMGG